MESTEARLESRLKDLREQFAAGQNVLAEMNKKHDELRATLLRISGAIQVLEELLGGKPSTACELAPHASSAVDAPR